jgi:hypothetical protein
VKLFISKVWRKGAWLEHAVLDGIKHAFEEMECERVTVTVSSKTKSFYSRLYKALGFKYSIAVAG